MYKLTIESNFSSAHQLRGYKGKCENLHGHNWKVQVCVTSDKLNDVDLVVDFHELKSMTHQILSQLDHKVLNNVYPFTEINPSSENIAKWIFESLKEKLSEYDFLKLSSVSVWESDTASATYYED
ncbi:MAG: 6-carboxytetrahydropterin synthase QueD [Thermodesulfovibrionales bacterium]|nr:6-carboxytetrahydropterin synthase QueD [Thermodesulfovibrionales bacterium]